MNPIVDFRNKFRLSELAIFETQYWTWSLRPEQTTLGSGVLSLRRGCSRFSELKPQEYYDLEIVIKVIENTLQDIFSYDVMNYLMLMMIDKQVHFHIIPRYATERWFFGHKWEDNGWPGPPSLKETGEKANLLEIKDFIKAGLLTPQQKSEENFDEEI